MRRISRGFLAFASSCALAAPAFAQQQQQGAPPAQQQQQQQPQANPPANICIELTSFLDQSQKAAQQAQQPGQPAAQPPQQQAAQQGQAAPQAPSQDRGGGTAVEQPRAGAQAPGGQDHPQRTSGMSGQVTQGGPGAAGPQGDAQETAKSSAGTTKPGAQPPQAQAQAQIQKPPEPKAPPPSPQAVEKARQTAGANDIEGCSGVVRDMRLAGVALPGPLIALAALKPELRALAPQGPAPGVPPIPASGVQPQDGAASGPGAAPPAQQPAPR